MALAVKEWLATYPAVRMAHRADHPAGRGLEAWQDDQGATFLRSLIVDPAAKDLTRKAVLRAYSVGIASPEQRKSSRCPRYEIIGGRLIEVSLVDSPSNARCAIEVCKSVAGVPRYIGKVRVMAGQDPRMVKADKHLRKAAQLLGVDVRDLDAAAVVEKALRPQMAAALESANPWMREMAREVLGGSA